GPAERPHRPDRRADPQHEGLAVPHASEPQRLHRHARGTAAAGGRPVRLGPRRQAEAADGVRVPAAGRGRRAQGTRGTQDDGQGAVDSVNVAQLLERPTASWTPPCRRLRAPSPVSVSSPESGSACTCPTARSSRAFADYKVPSRIEFVPALPKNSTGKILKNELRARG